VVAWYCKIDDVEHGPLSQDDLVRMAGEGRLSASDLVRNEQKKKWYKAGTVKGLKFPADEDTVRPSRPSEPEPAGGLGTSAEAVRLLKGLTKKGSDRGGEVTIQSRPADDWKPAPSAVMQKPPRKPLDPLTKRILWGAGAVMLALVLFPPHQIPADFAMAKGWYFAPIFAPPTATVKLFQEGDKDVKGIGSFDNMEIEVVDEGGKKIYYAKEPMRVHWTRLLLECFVVVVVTAAAIGILAARTAAAQVPDSKPGRPPRRKQV
jgi:GYF domain 2